MVKMKRQTIGILFACLLILQITALAIPSATAQIASRSTNSEWGIFQPFSMIVDPIIHLFNKSGDLSGDQKAGITRLVIWIAVFAVVYQGLTVVSGQNGWIKGNVAIALAFAFATISAIFMPQEWVLQIGSSWAQVAFLLLLSPILIAIAVYAFNTRDNNPLLSASALFLLMGILFYFWTVVGVANPANNTVAIGGVDFTGILDIVINYALLIVAICFLIQLFRGLSRLSGGAAGGGGGGPNLGNLLGGGQGNQPAGGGPPAPQVMPPPGPANPQVQQQQQQLQQQINDIVQQMNQLQGQIQQMQQAWGNPGQQVMTGQQITWLTAAITQLINLQQQYITLQNQINATP